jgi:hypothetical protein
MMTASWFKRQDPDQTLTVESLAKDLQNTIVQAELSSEQRCEASEALYYIHDTYRQDLEKLAPEIIKTQLKYLTDEDWSVRAQACTAMLGYQADQFPDSSLFDETLKSLIPMLEDPNEVVRSLAYSVLVAYGITSSHQLKDTIKSLGLLDESNPDRSELRSSKSRSGTRSAKVYKLRSTPFEQSDRVYVMQGGKVYTVDPEITPVRTRSASSRGKSAK